MKSRALAIGVGVAAVIAISAAGSTAASPARRPSRALCRLDFPWKLRVPTSMTPTRGRFTSTKGTFTCQGTVLGSTAINRPGRLVATERYGPDTCLAGHGAGPFRAVVNTTGGPLRVHGVFYERRVAATGITTGWLSTGHRAVARFRGSYALIPAAAQNCFTTPVRSGTVKATVILSG